MIKVVNFTKLESTDKILAIEIREKKMACRMNILFSS